MKHALITGGAGFIGSHLAEALVARDWRVTVVDDESTGTADNLAALRDHFNFTFIPGTAADKALLRRLLADVDEVYHLAAAEGMQLLALAPIHAIETNVYPTELLLCELLRQLKRGHEVKLFLASSSEVYGKNPRPRWSEEDDLVFGPTSHTRWAYGVSHALDEFLALAYWRQHRLPLVVGRFFNVAGPRQLAANGTVVPRFVEAALTGGPLVVYDDGQQVRCFLHVADAVRAMIDLMASPRAVAGVYNIGSGEPVTVLQLAHEVIAAVKPGLPVVFQTYAEAFGKDAEDVRTRIPDLARLRAAIEFRPQYDLRTIVREVVEDVRARSRR